MRRFDGGLEQRERPPVERPRFWVALLYAAEDGEIVECWRELGMVAAEHGLLDRERAPVERLGGVEFAPAVVDRGQVAVVDREFVMPFAVGRREVVERVAQEPLGLALAAEGVED